MRIDHNIRVDSAEAHLFGVHLRISSPKKQQRLRLPVWIAGSYLVREFSQHLQALTAKQGRTPCQITQCSKNEWLVESDGKRPLELNYQIYAFDASVRTAFLDNTRGFFNPTSLCLQVVGGEDEIQTISVERPTAPAFNAWRLSTALPARQIDARGFGRYTARNYGELADSPFTLGDFYVSRFKVSGVPHELVVTGIGNHTAPGFDVKKLVADTRRICETEITFWHGKQPQRQLPFDRYVFMLHATENGYGGLEHIASTALICQRADLPLTAVAGEAAPPHAQGAGYNQLLGLISHEYFHTWNVKRLRPSEFASIDFNQENYTELLWFFEGFTSYYDDLFLQRAKLIDTATYLTLLAKSINHVAATPGRHLQSVAQSSYDAWVKYYRIGENTPNATVSYYTKGALIALCTDLMLRQQGGDLDTLMRGPWVKSKGGTISEADIYALLNQQGHANVATQLAHWVHSTEDLPVHALLSHYGVAVAAKSGTLAQRLGMRVVERDGIRITHVARGGAGEQAGMAAGDEWVTLFDGTDQWRVKSLSDVENIARRHADVAQHPLVAGVARDGRMLSCPLIWPSTHANQIAELVVKDPSKLTAWL